jgi:DNA-binding Lrp family transcriptional regulator
MKRIKNLGKYGIKGAKPWNTGKIKDKDFILANYKTMSNDDIGKKLNVSREAIRKRLKRMHIHRTDEEIKNHHYNNKYKMSNSGINHPLYGKHRIDEVKALISKKLKYRKEPYKKITKRVKVNNKWKTKPLSNIIWCQENQIYRLPPECVIHHLDLNPKNNTKENYDENMAKRAKENFEKGTMTKERIREVYFYDIDTDKFTKNLKPW